MQLLVINTSCFKSVDILKARLFFNIIINFLLCNFGIITSILNILSVIIELLVKLS